MRALEHYSGTHALNPRHSGVYERYNCTAVMPRSRGTGASNIGGQLQQQGGERVASPDDTQGSDDDSENEVLENNGRYQKMLEQVR